MALSIKCHGQFYARERQLKMMKEFDEIVRAPSLKFFEQTNTRYTGTDDNGQLQFRETSFINVRGVLKKKLLPMILAKKFPGVFVRVRGVVIDEVTSEGNEAIDLPVQLMSFKQLGALIAQRKFPLDVNSYLDIDELRTDYLEYEQDPEAFKRNFERKAKKRSEEREFMELNGLTPNTAPSPVSAPKTGKKKGVAELSDGPVSAQPF